MGGSRIEEICERKLSDVSQALKRAGIQHLLLIPIQVYEDVDRVSNLVKNLSHGTADLSFVICSPEVKDIISFYNWTRKRVGRGS
jgi:hypothetical protein